MNDHWHNGVQVAKDIVFEFLHEMKQILNKKFYGLYIHGSLAMGCFNPNRSDIDILVVTKECLTVEEKRALAAKCLRLSNHPFPIEVSILHLDDLENWVHPCRFEFHYSEYWRNRYEDDLVSGTNHFLHSNIQRDADLAAHITILNQRGICIEGEPIIEVFPKIPVEDYLSSILGDFQDCLENVETTPVYCILNMVRVYWFLKEDVVSSKEEAGDWGKTYFPKEIALPIYKAVENYRNENVIYMFEQYELDSIKQYFSKHIHKLLPE